MDYTGIIRAAYVVRHRVTGELGLVQLGAKYNQQQWELLHPVEIQHATYTSN